MSDSEQKHFGSSAQGDGQTPAATSRRQILKSMLVAGVAAGVAGIAAASDRADAATANKVSKAVAKYQDHPNNGHKCSGCTYFEPPHSCRLVEGHIAPDGWCQFWTKKA